MNTEAENEVMISHVTAVHQMLLNGKPLKPGLSIVAGDRRRPDNPLEVAKVAKASGDDIVHLGFDRIEGEFRFVELTLYVVRDHATYIVPYCQFYTTSRNGRAVVIPPTSYKGSFRLAVNEIVHLRRIPIDRETGIARANAYLQALLRNPDRPQPSWPVTVIG